MTFSFRYTDCGSEVERLYNHHICLKSGNLASYFGITKDPTSNYAFVMKYYERGDFIFVPRGSGLEKYY
ncbi:16878_t:CDS:2 [Funneliformis caledonium]|uniref:16878_t:CDS:1 n=1 Tax=Funneliformis caledonium TaxID=1117310 RepID=A0A9N9G838_9GLOM|nr:16878_t:CDS:2 [Funneliformis caledonium]